ncbi:MAG: sensor histidine kinase [Granulosicoccus sp.]
MAVNSKSAREASYADGKVNGMSNSQSDSDVDGSALTEMINTMGQAVALLDLESDCIRWCSSAWQRELPQLSQGLCWSESIESWAEVAQLYQDFKQHGHCAGMVQCKHFDQARELTLSSLSSGLVLLHLHDNLRATDDMHLYMEARESMFTTSRTISVSEMATTLAHEIKQPIATITNILKGVRIRLGKFDGGEQSEKLQEALENALEQAQFTDSVINRIRDFTQARRPQQKTINVAELADEALSLMDWLLRANQCRIKLTLNDEPLLCVGDPTMLQQVLINLLRNGVEAMQERSAADRLLIIECKRNAAAVRISIRDNGHGLEGKEQSLFVPFSTSKASGMGVGLNICRSFVELHQGRLWLSPNSDGGCTSNVELPLVEEARSSAIGTNTNDRSEA